MNLLDIIFPKKCVGCGKEGKYVCDSCIGMATKQWLLCPECRRLSPTGKTHDDCLTDFGLDGLISIYKYRRMIKKAIGSLKYKFAYELASELSVICSNNLKNIAYLKNSIIVPIPLYTKRENWRGFNQSEELAKILSENLSWELKINLLIRVKYSKPQVGLDNTERVRNICGEFAVNENMVEAIDWSKTIVLFDDVWTSGSTIKEACKELKNKGFKSVWGVTVAR